MSLYTLSGCSPRKNDCEKGLLWVNCFTRPMPVKKTYSPNTLESSVLTPRSISIGQNRLVPAEPYLVLTTTASGFCRNDSPLGCSELVLAYRYNFVWKKHENLRPRTGANNNIERNASWVGCQCKPGTQYTYSTCLVQHVKHSAITHPSKRIGTSWAASHTHWIQ